MDEECEKVGGGMVNDDDTGERYEVGGGRAVPVNASCIDGREGSEGFCICRTLCCKDSSCLLSEVLLNSGGETRSLFEVPSDHDWYGGGGPPLV